MYRKLMAVSVCLIVSGCGSMTKPQQASFPVPPAQLMLPAHKLVAIAKPVPAKQALPVITGNYENCRVGLDRLEQLQEWAREQGSGK